MNLSLLISVIALILIGLTECQKSHRILGIFPLNGKSHMGMFEQVMKGLARRGHQVDVVSTFPQSKPYPNYTDIEIPSALPKFVNSMTYEFVEDVNRGNLVHFIAAKIGNLVCEKGLENLDTPNLIKDPPKYDLIIVEVSCRCY
ncbi:GSCOCG00004996001-RA-CDS [Cotesia congregata]|nr:GSCOCG00004996001-RA-CDS [Cotesia congregata]